MGASDPEWIAPVTLDEALTVRGERGDEATVLAGGTFLVILMNQHLIAPEALLSLSAVRGIDYIGEVEGELRLGAMARHRDIERSAVVREGWPVLAHAFSLVASPRVRNQATVGGVLADADYASDPPAVLAALGARAVLRSRRGTRTVAIGELILGFYETCIEPDELLVEVRVPPCPVRAVYRKFRSRSREDRPCVAVAAARGDDGLRVVVGAVCDRPRELPDALALAGAGAPGPNETAEIARRYAREIDPLDDARGSSAYRRRIIEVEVRRALEALA
ncbi:MAG TPA: FAD binding domain-containing protein [Thermoleophilaceae bacterium]|nr:FAD binding domain-containing protein [Thermoleophilaceae bacterium]